MEARVSPGAQQARGAGEEKRQYLQKLPVCLGPDQDNLFGLVPGDLPVEPGHLLVGGGGDELLQLRLLADDGLLQRLALRAELRSGEGSGEASGAHRPES